VQIEIVRRFDPAKDPVVLPRHWVVARTIASFNQCRRLAKDWKTSTAPRLISYASPPSA